MSVLSKIVHALFSNDDTPSMYYTLISREYNGGRRPGEARFAIDRGVSSGETRVTFRAVEPAGGATEDVAYH